MTIEEAIQRLQQQGTSAADVRKQYLRLLKSHGPEVDPAGFAALREGYETLTGRGAGRTAFPVVTVMETPPTSDSAAADQEYAPDPLSSAAPIPGPPEDADARAALDLLEDRLDALSPIAYDERIAAARGLVAQYPGLADAHWLLVDELTSAHYTKNLGEALRAGDEAGHRGFLRAWLTGYGDQLFAETERVLPHARQAPIENVWLAPILVQQGKIHDAVDLATRSLELIDDDPRGDSLILTIAHTVLALLEHGHPSHAAALFVRIDRFVDARGGERRVLGQDDCLTFCMTRELVQLSAIAGAPPDGPPAKRKVARYEVLAILSRGVRTGDHRKLEDALDLIRLRERRALHLDLSTAPTLALVFGETLHVIGSRAYELNLLSGVAPELAKDKDTIWATAVGLGVTLVFVIARAGCF